MSTTEMLLSNTDAKILLWQREQKETKDESKLKVFTLMIHRQTALSPLAPHSKFLHMIQISLIILSFP